MNNTLAQRVLWVLWPAFLVAAIGEMAFFALFDPLDLHVLGVPLEADRMSVYAVGFFAIWAMCAGSASLAVFMQRSPFEVNRCPLDADQRPNGCPKQCVGGAVAAAEPAQRQQPSLSGG
jgi:hypothetical protein